MAQTEQILSVTSPRTKPLQKSPWIPLEKTLPSYLRTAFKTDALESVDPLAAFTPVHLSHRYVRFRWSVQLRASIRDLERFEASEQTEYPGAVFLRALQTDSTYAQLLKDLETSGYDVTHTHPLSVSIVKAASSFPVELGVSLHLPQHSPGGSNGNVGPTPASPDSTSSSSSSSSSYWDEMAKGFICSIAPNASEPSDMKRAKSIYPLACTPITGVSSTAPRAGDGEVTPENGGPLAITAIDGEDEIKDTVFTVMRSGGAVYKYATILGTLPVERLSSGCIALPAHPDPGYQGPSVPLAQQFVLIPASHILAVAARGLADDRIYQVALGTNVGQLLLAIPKDVATEAAQMLVKSRFEDLRQRQVDLSQMAIQLGPRHAPGFSTCPVQEDNWDAPHDFSLELDMLAIVFKTSVREGTSACPLVPGTP